MSWRCQHACRKPIVDGACVECGAVPPLVLTEERVCRRCGVPTDHESGYCMGCRSIARSTGIAGNHAHLWSGRVVGLGSGFRARKKRK